MHFRAVVVLGGKTATGIEVPEEVVARLGSSKRPPVRITINGYTYRSTVAPRGGVFMLPVSAEVRAGAGIAAGDEIEVDLALDDEPRAVAVPPDLRAALDGDPQARTAFEGLSYSNQRALVLAIEDAKTAETRQRRLAKTLESLHQGRI